MKPIKLKDIIYNVCVAFTILSVVSAIIKIVTTGSMSRYSFDVIQMFIWTTIAVGSLSIYNWFENLSLGAVMIIQYLIAMTLVIINVWITGHFVELHPDAYKDAFITFTIPYIIGAIAFYIGILSDVKKQNETLNFIRRKKV